MFKIVLDLQKDLYDGVESSYNHIQFQLLSNNIVPLSKINEPTLIDN